MNQLSKRDQISIQRLKDVYMLLQSPVRTSFSELHSVTGITFNKLTILLDKGVIKRSGQIYVWDSIEPTMHMLKALRQEQKKRWFDKNTHVEVENKKTSTYKKGDEELSSIHTEGDYYIIRVRKDHTESISSMIVFHEVFGSN